MHWCFTSSSREATVAAGEHLGRLLKAGDVVALNGDLGAGKTALTTGIATGMGCGGHVSSPTFILQRTYPAGSGGLTLHHFDLYRLDGAEAFLELGFEEFLEGTDVCVLEWADIAAEVLPARTLRITLRNEGGDCRKLELGIPESEEQRFLVLTGRLQSVPGILEEKTHEDPGL